MVRWVRGVLIVSAVAVSLGWALPASAAAGPDLTLQAVPKKPTTTSLVVARNGRVLHFRGTPDRRCRRGDHLQLPPDVSLVKVQHATAAYFTTLNCPATGTPGQYSCDVGVVHPGGCCGPQIRIVFSIPADASIGPKEVTATVSSPAGADPNPADNSATYTFLATGTSHFTYALSGPVIPAGGSAWFVLTIRNVGPDAAPNVKVSIGQPVSKHFSYAHPTFSFVSFSSSNVTPGGNSMDWAVPGTLEPGEQARLTIKLGASGVDQVGSMRVFVYSDSAGNCGYSDCGITFTLHATALAKTSPSPSPSGPALAETGKPNNRIGETGGAARARRTVAARRRSREDRWRKP